MEGLKKTQANFQAKIDREAANAAAAAVRAEEGAGDDKVDEEGGEGGGEAGMCVYFTEDATATDTVVDEGEEGYEGDEVDEGDGSDSDGKGRQRPLSASSVQKKPFFFEADTEARKADNYTKKCDEIL